MQLPPSTEIEAAARRLESAKYLEEVEFKDIHLICKALREAQKDTAALDCLSDPEFTFRYSIAANGRANVTRPLLVSAPSLRTAVKWSKDWELENSAKIARGE